MTLNSSTSLQRRAAAQRRESTPSTNSCCLLLSACRPLSSCSPLVLTFLVSTDCPRSVVPIKIPLGFLSYSNFSLIKAVSLLYQISAQSQDRGHSLTKRASEFFLQAFLDASYSCVRLKQIPSGAEPLVTVTIDFISSLLCLLRYNNMCSKAPCRIYGTATNATHA
ncbi:hypothetical protein BDQ12DRAFT_256975 [Crucibulum laeve]|uniref:Uncharacterized protein n=1 Tax=Crucibulum laeve TaxID=68775 RepID=A0A5C3LR35_9AGAR|nr:hypothetical protein BDQ12DRAFT_256975 [Crucibulum laeve]